MRKLAILCILSILVLGGCTATPPVPEPTPAPAPAPPLPAPAPAPTPTPGPAPVEYDEIISLFEEVEGDINHAEVYINNNKFEEARQSIVDAQLHLSDAQTLLNKANLSDIEEENTGLAISCLTEMLVGFNNLIDVLEVIEAGTWLTWGPYNEIIDSTMEAQGRLTAAQEIASDITDQELIEGMEFGEITADINEILEQLQTEELLAVIKVYTYIDKIDTESVRDLAIEVTEPATSDKKEVTAIFNYVRDTIKYVKDPRLTQLDFDYIQPPLQTIERKAGDCDDHAVLLASLLESIGYSTMICFVDTDEEEPFEPDHMNVIVTVDDAEYILEATCKDCSTGEYPGEMYYEGYDYAEFKAAMLEAMGKAS